MHYFAAILLLLVATTSTLAADSGVQITQQGPEIILVQKDVGGERWAMNFSLEPTSPMEATGNVFRPGGAPAFVQCRPVDVLNPSAPIQNRVIVYNCFGADACGAPPCTASQWRFISTVEIPGSFLLP